MEAAKWMSHAVFAVFVVVPASVAGQDSPASRLIDLNRSLMHEQIVEKEASLFNEVSFEDFLVVAPGGRIEDKAQAAAGVSAWDATSIDVRDEQVTFHGGSSTLWMGKG